MVVLQFVLKPPIQTLFGSLVSFEHYYGCTMKYLNSKFSDLLTFFGHAGDLDFSSDKNSHSRLFSNVLILQKQLASLKEQSTSSMLTIRSL